MKIQSIFLLAILFIAISLLPSCEAVQVNHEG